MNHNKSWDPSEAQQTRNIHSIMKNNLADFVSDHRKKAMTAVEHKKICASCGAKSCTFKCAKCKSVSYCNRECQAADWPNHKRVCKIFQHVLVTFQRIPVSSEDDVQILASHCSETFGVILSMAGIEADVLFCAHDNHNRKMVTSPVVLADGRLYDMATPLCRGMYPGVTIRDRRPLPPANEIEEGSILEAVLMDLQNRSVLYGIYYPWNIPFNIDKNDRLLLVKQTCKSLIEEHYMKSQYKDTILNLYGEFNTIRKATGESVLEFQTRMDELCGEDRSAEASWLHFTRMYKMMCQEMPLTAGTRHILRAKWAKSHDITLSKAAGAISKTEEQYKYNLGKMIMECPR